MAIAQPASNDALNSPDHALLHRIIAADPAAAVQSLTVDSGNIIGIKAGIKFPATAVSSADVNTLDDYEEGTWTPNVGGNATYTTQLGEYTKIGNKVTVCGYMAIDSIGTGSVYIFSGLPFTASSGFHKPGYLDRIIDFATNWYWLAINIKASTAECEFYYQDALDGSSNNVNPAFKDGTTIRFSITYTI